MKTALTLSLLIMPGLLMAQMNNWGSGQMMGGQQGCAFPQQMGQQARSESDEVVELRNQIKDLEKQRQERNKELQQAKNELRKSESGLKTSFDDEVFTFLKNHFDSGNRCQDYQGFGENRKPKEKNEDSVIEAVEPRVLAIEWANVCDQENNPRARVKPDICSKQSLLSKPDGNSCRDAVVRYPRAKNDVNRLLKEIEILKESIAESKTALAEARKQKPEMDDADKTEGGICLECLAGNGGSGRGGQRGNVGGGGSNLTGVVTNSLMALMAYSSTKNFYGEMADTNANLGFPTPMPASSPFMAATPYLLGALNTGLGQGSFGCAGQSGMSNNGGMTAMMNGGLNAMMIGGQQQMGGAFGMPQWSQSSPLAALTMMGGLNLNGGMNMGGLSMMNGYSPYSLAGLSGAGGLSGLSGLSGLNGLSGLSGLNGLSGLTSNPQMLQFQMQQQQLAMQQQMQYYQNAMQKTQAMSGLQTELAGVIQRIQQIQNSNIYGTSSYQYGVSGGLGGLPSYSTSYTTGR